MLIFSIKEGLLDEVTQGLFRESHCGRIGKWENKITQSPKGQNELRPLI
jgi:hypothetical protein